jgi:heat shock protein 4
MAAVGLDIGDLNMVVAVARRAGIDILLNQESKRETPALVNFADKQVRRSPVRLPRSPMSPISPLWTSGRLVPL